MSEESIFTDIGVLEWNMGTISNTMLDIENHLQFIRPTMPDDLTNKYQLIVRDYVLQDGDGNKTAISRTILAALLALEHYYGISSGRTLLHLRMEQLNQNFKMRCTAYRYPLPNEKRRN